jgi:hypothetical protein
MSIDLIFSGQFPQTFPKNWLKSGHEIWIEAGQLHKLIWRNGIEHTLESFHLPYDLSTEIRAKLD